MNRLKLINLIPLLLLLSGCTSIKAPVKNTQQPTPVPPPAPQGTKPLESWQVYFSPNGGAADAVVNAIRGAQDTILVQAYSFTSAPIAAALRDAHRRGVRVRAILDDSNESSKYSAADFLVRAGISTWLDSKHAIAHNKVMIIDGHTVITGSFNFTKAAEERNAENLLIIRDTELAERYTENWKAHQEHSEVYEGKSAASSSPRKTQKGTRKKEAPVSRSL